MSSDRLQATELYKEIECAMHAMDVCTEGVEAKNVSCFVANIEKSMDYLLHLPNARKDYKMDKTTDIFGLIHLYAV